MPGKYTDDMLRSILNTLIQKGKRGPRQSCMKCDGRGWVTTNEGIWKQIGMGPCECLNVKKEDLPKGTPYV
jgi:hypothetical protein